MLKIKYITFLVLCVSLIFNKAEAQKKPNILWLVIEDTSPQFIGCYGDSVAKTPNIDKLAKEGVRFQNAFSTGTVCSPSRSTIITGVRTFEMGTGNHRSYYPIPDFIKGFPYYLKQAGYYTTNNSKTDYNTTDAQRLIKNSWNESSKKAGWWNRKNGQHFFSVFNFDDSHQSRVMTNPYEIYTKQVLTNLPKSLQTQDTDFKIPPIFKDTPEMRHQLTRIYNGISLTDYYIGKIIDSLKSDGLLDSTIIFFYADHGQAMPKGKANGIDLGHRVPFVVWFPEAYKNLSPFGTGGVVTDELIDFADLAPTLLKLAGVEVPDYMHGRNILGTKPTHATKNLFLTSDGSECVANVMRTITNGNLSYTRAFMPFMPQMFYSKYFDFSEILQQMRKDFKDNKLSDTQRQMFETGVTEYLYDFKNDPWQINNLAKDPKYKSIIAQMRKNLKDSIIKNKDVMFLHEYEIDKISKTTTPYQFRLNNIDYPIEEIYKTALLTGVNTKSTLVKQLSLLNHSNKYVRYWAAIGLKSQGILIKDYRNQLFSKLDDSYLPVKVILASICYDNFNDNKSKNILNDFLTIKNEEKLNLLTLQMLIFQKNNIEFVPTVKQLLTQKDITGNLRDGAEVFLYKTIGTPLKYETYW